MDNKETIKKQFAEVEKHILDMLASKQLTEEQAQKALEELNKRKIDMLGSEGYEDISSYSPDYVDDDMDSKNNNENTNESEENLSKSSKDRKISKKTIAALSALGILGGTAATFGIASCTRNQKADSDVNVASASIDFDKATFDELMKTLAEDSERRQFAQSVYDVTLKLNGIVRDENVFALEEDKDAYLQFTYDEVVAANLVLNNYSSEELQDIFGMDELNTLKVMENYQSFASKMMIYSMNAKAASGVSSLITNEANREWFEKIENSIVNFNKDVTSTNADNLIRTFAYFYQHGINGVDNLENDESSLSGIKNLAFNMVRGYYDANVEKDYSGYLKVSSEPSEFDDKYRSNKTSQVQKGEKLKFYLDQAEKGACTISRVQEHLDGLRDKLLKTQEQHEAYEQLLLTNLSAKVLDAGDIELANKVMTEGVTEETEELFSKAHKDSKKALDAYKISFAALNENIPSYIQIKNAADRELGPYIEVKDDVLYNNRVRGTEKIDELSNGSTISKSEWNNMSHKQQVEYAKENGKVVKKTTTTTEKKVSYDDLTPSEKKEADRKAEQVKRDTYQVEISGKKYDAGETSAAAKRGWMAATNYAEEKGAYNYHTIYNKINPDAVSAVPTNGTLSDIAQAAYAFEGKTITSGDSQIQARLRSDVEGFKQNISSDTKLVEAYKSGWLDGIEQKLTAAINQGKITKAEAERLYNEAKQNADAKNNSSENNTLIPSATPSNGIVSEVVDNTPVYSEVPTVNDIDPNLNTVIEDSDDGLVDIYDENYDSNDTKKENNVNIAPQSEIPLSQDQDYYSYVSDLTLKALDEYYEQDKEEDPIVLVR